MKKYIYIIIASIFLTSNLYPLHVSDSVNNLFIDKMPIWIGEGPGNDIYGFKENNVTIGSLKEINMNEIDMALSTSENVDEIIIAVEVLEPVKLLKFGFYLHVGEKKFMISHKKCKYKNNGYTIRFICNDSEFPIEGSISDIKNTSSTTYLTVVFLENFEVEKRLPEFERSKYNITSVSCIDLYMATSKANPSSNLKCDKISYRG